MINFNIGLLNWIDISHWRSLCRANVAKREKELKLKLESTDNARHILDSSDSGTDELELQLQKCIIERNDLELTLEEAKQDTGRKDIKVEFRVMASALSKEMGMMEAQLKRWKDAALEAVSLRDKAHSLRATLSGK
ncbi:E3 ubiquitin-protein ligase BRE1-like protein, partial [Trifolium medium]|nr:E3 ubiquitin-protein ligase BRE1-like protein [Trifolium medium]